MRRCSSLTCQCAVGCHAPVCVSVRQCASACVGVPSRPCDVCPPAQVEKLFFHGGHTSPARGMVFEDESIQTSPLMDIKETSPFEDAKVVGAWDHFDEDVEGRLDRAS
jgi:hypothetical protein